MTQFSPMRFLSTRRLLTAMPLMFPVIGAASVVTAETAIYSCSATEVCDTENRCEDLPYAFELTIPPQPGDATLIDESQTYTVPFVSTDGDTALYALQSDKFTVQERSGPAASVTITGDYFGQDVTMLANCPTAELRP